MKPSYLKPVSLLLLVFCFTTAFSQDNNLLLLQKISSLQSTGNKKYAKGVFPSQRVYKPLFSRCEDDNMFFTGIIAWTLINTKASLTDEEQTIADSVINRAISIYPAYKNKDGLETYNFWRTNPSGHFPHGIFSKFSKFKIPDDIDVTSVIYLTSEHKTTEIETLKSRMADHANLSHLKIKNTFRDYKELKAYSTWFGKKMPIDFDACVLSNTLCFILKNKLPLNQHDSASIKYIQRVLSDNEHIKHPFYAARHYPRTSIILYHVARLISLYDVPGLSNYRAKVISDIQKELSGTHNYMENVLLSTSLLRLGVDAPPIETSINRVHKQYKKFNFFVANMLLTNETAFGWWLSRFSIFHLGYKSEAYYLTLVLENNIYREKLTKSNKKS